MEKTYFDISFKNFKRESCYHCSFRYPYSAADITAGDHISINENDLGYNSGGVSIIFVHTEKGEKFLNRLKKDFFIFSEDFEKASGIQACLYKCILKNDMTEKFKTILHSEGLKVASDFIGNAKKERFKNVIYPLLSFAKQHEIFRYVIWGVGKYFQITYDTVQQMIPNAKLVGIIDKYKTGQKLGVNIITKEKIKELDFDHVFVTTVNGQEEAIDFLSNVYKNRPGRYSLAIPEYERAEKAQ